MSNPSEIYLAPACSADAYGEEGRLWCEDDAWEDYVCECGMGCKTVRYVRAAGVSAPGGGSTGTGRAELDRLLDSARKHEMTSHELAEQRASWVRGEMAMGSDADEAAYREKLRKGKE